MSRNQRERIIKAIEEKLLQGKTVRKVIHNELIKEGLITDNPEDDTVPNLKESRIAQYIKFSRERLGVDLPLSKNKILDLHDKMVASSTARNKLMAHCGFIAIEARCTQDWVREVLRKYRPSYSNRRKQNGL